ncbi:MAG: Rab family GTPase, partial [Candidatus Kariarchaeaceae archaeon]
MSQRDEVKIKVILLGNGSVGKTSLANRFTRDKFASTYKPSLGVDFMVKRMEYDGENVKILVFDTAGQEFISSLRKRYYAGASGAVIVFDLTSKRSFDDLHRWVDEVRGEVGNIHTVFVGNKTDLTDEREISTMEGQTYANTMEGEYIESSAKFGDRVQEI